MRSTLAEVHFNIQLGILFTLSAFRSIRLHAEGEEGVLSGSSQALCTFIADLMCVYMDNSHKCSVGSLCAINTCNKHGRTGNLLAFIHFC